MPKPLEVTLPSDREVRVVRTFNAPRALVWDAHTKPELIQKWMGGLPGWTMTVCEMDVRVGGKYRWRWRGDTDNKEFGFHGVFSEVNAPAKLAHSQYYDPGDFGGDMGDGTLIAVAFVEDEGFTTVTTVMDFKTPQARDAAVFTGMTDGMEHSYQQLDQLIAKR